MEMRSDSKPGENIGERCLAPNDAKGCETLWNPKKPKSKRIRRNTGRKALKSKTLGLSQSQSSPAMPGGLSPLRGPEADVRFHAWQGEHRGLERLLLYFVCLSHFFPFWHSHNTAKSIYINLSFDTARLPMAILWSQGDFIMFHMVSLAVLSKTWFVLAPHAAIAGATYWGLLARIWCCADLISLKFALVFLACN